MSASRHDIYRMLLNRAAEQAKEDPAMAAAAAIEVYKNLKQELETATKPWSDLVAEAKTTVEQAVAALGVRNLKTSEGQAYWPDDGVTVTYDAKKLDVLCADDPLLAARLSPYRTEKVRPGAFTIR